MNKQTYEKMNIAEKDMKANICDTVEIVADIHGVSTNDIEKMLKRLTGILPSSIYSRYIDSFNNDELNDYGNRQVYGLSKEARKRYAETENIIRYISNDENVRITISRFFISVTLSYKIINMIDKYVDLMRDILNEFNGLDYFRVERLVLVKHYLIYCNSLYRMYQCFDKNLFADLGFLLSRNIRKKDIKTGNVHAYNNITYKGVEVIVDKKIVEGTLWRTSKKSYQGKIDLTTFLQPEAEEVDAVDAYQKLNNISFEVFMHHITEAFANDLLTGNSNKIRRGLNIYE